MVLESVYSPVGFFVANCATDARQRGRHKREDKQEMRKEDILNT